MNGPLKRESFQEVVHWCREYLELQHSPEVGAHFAGLLNALEEIACCGRAAVFPADADWQRLRALETDVEESLQNLAQAQARSAHRKQQLRFLRSREDRSQVSPLFVYGTLKRGHCRNWALAEQKFVGEAVTQPHYLMLDCGEYPGLVESSTGIAIRGELWEISNSCRNQLDDIEGVSGGIYRRGRIDLKAPYQDWDVQSYFYLPSSSGLKSCGDCW